MKNYTKYFGDLIRAQGQPILSDYEFRRMMNIVYLEGLRRGIDCVRSKLKASAYAHKFDMDYFELGMKLTELTGNVEPQELMQQMVRKPLD
jgi:hypothetical protein